MMKILFQNVNTINDYKTKILSSTLHEHDMLCLSELNKIYDFENSLNYQYHLDVTTPRIGVMATNSLNVENGGIGIMLSQDRKQVDKTVIQSNIYKIKHLNRNIFIENIYVVPDTNKANIDILVNHIDEQSKKYKYYMIGGDFNLNWLLHSNRLLFSSISNVTQLVKGYTRIRKYNTKRGLQRTSKTSIDLIFCNANLKHLTDAIYLK